MSFDTDEKICTQIQIRRPFLTTFNHCKLTASILKMSAVKIVSQNQIKTTSRFGSPSKMITSKHARFSIEVLLHSTVSFTDFV